MTAPVRIEAEAWDDLRFRTLARLLGLLDEDHALIRCARLWSWQAENYTPETPTYVVDSDTIESALKASGAAEAMVRSKLAEAVPGGFRIKGAEGRIEWLWQRRQAAKSGGEAKKRMARNKEKPVGLPVGLPPAEPVELPKPCPLVLVIPEDRRSLPPARDPAVPSTSTLPDRQARRAELWRELEFERGRVAAEIGIVARPLPVQDPGERELASLLANSQDIERITTDVRHAIAMAVLEARRDRSVQWLSGAMFQERSFRRLVAMTAEDATRPRQPARSQAGDRPAPPERPNPLRPM